MYLNNPSFHFEKTQKDWMIGMEQSNFTLAPSGRGHDSFRRWEAFLLGTIPIYVYTSPEAWLPYREQIDWEMLSVNVHESSLEDIAVAILDLENSWNIPAMQDYIRQCKQYFTYDFMLEYIVQDLMDH